MRHEHLPSTISSAGISELDQIDRWCLDLESAWSAGRFLEFWQNLPPLSQQARALLFRFMLRIDQEQHSSAGLPATDEYYLKTFPHDYPEYLRELSADPEFETMNPSSWLTPMPSLPTTVLHQDSSSAKNVPHIPGYLITKQLGGGGMGEVWFATQLSTKRPVALKLIRGDLRMLEAAQQRFEREIELAANLDHPNIARIYDARIDLNPAYYAMEFINGETFDRYLSNPQRTLEQALHVYRQACEGIAYAHQQHVLHRDLKPGNILVDHHGNAKIIDFGIAKLMRANADNLTTPGGRLGTPEYMAPEQDSGRSSEATQASDVYSLGVILQRILARFYDHPSKYPAQLAALVPRTTNKDSNLRPQSVSEILAALPKHSATSWSKLLTPFRLGIGVLLIVILAGLGLYIKKISIVITVLPVPVALQGTPAGQVLNVLLNGNPPPAKHDLSLDCEFLYYPNRDPMLPLALEDGTKLRTEKDGYRMELLPSTDGYLYVFQIDARGKVDCHFPDYLHNPAANPHVKAQQQLTVPPQENLSDLNALKLDNNTGIEHLYVVFTAEPWVELEAALKAAVSQQQQGTVQGPYILQKFDVQQTRGSAGTVALQQPSDAPATAGKDKTYFLPMSQRHSMMLFERWFQHVE